MFSFPDTLRRYQLNADVRTLLDIIDSFEEGLVRNLGDLYAVGRALIVKDVREEGPYNLAFLDYFLDIKKERWESFDEAVRRSSAFQTWLDGVERERDVSYDGFDHSKLVDVFLDQVLEGSELATNQPLEVVAGDSFSQKPPDSRDEGGFTTEYQDKVGDYTNVDLETLKQQLKRISQWQEKAHTGGPFAMGTQGISPFGHSGRALGGIRIGGQGKGQMARKVIDDPAYYPVDSNRVVCDDNIDAAFSALKGATRSRVTYEFDAKRTIDEGLRQGFFFPYMHEEVKEKTEVLLLIDNGGSSMRRYARTVQKLFRKMRTRFNHDMEVYFFHNIIGNTVYEDERRWDKPIEMEMVLRMSPEYRVFIVGDASMDPYEIGEENIDILTRMRDKFPRTIWLNPVDRSDWGYTRTIGVIKDIIDMFPLTPKGIEESVRHMNRRI